ncbi:MAG TPA: choice-of-anchor Q domain-containing protein [Anaerolineae bacterium]|nr:choice-of-anchor Q domain-containing protein [Anaerolineae bacterium]
MLSQKFYGVMVVILLAVLGMVTVVRAEEGGGEEVVSGRAIGFFATNSTADNSDVNIGDGVCADVNGNCTLRAAMQESNAGAGPSYISMFAGTYTLGSVLVVNSDISILGNGALSRVIDGNNSTRVFEVREGAKLLLNQVTVRGGRAVSGANIYNYRGTVDVYASIIEGGMATSNGGSVRGGGIYNYQGEVIIRQGSTIADNQARVLAEGGTSYAYGGGIYSLSGTVTVTDSRIDQNMLDMSNNARAYGGGIYATNSTITVTNSSIEDNTVESANSLAGYGGGIYASSSAVVNLIDSTVISNSVNGQDDGYGGGIYNAGTMSLSGNNCQVRENFVQSVLNSDDEHGGGIYNTGTMSISCGFQENHADDSGGAIYTEHPITIVDSTFFLNDSDRSGGGIYAWLQPLETLTIEYSSFSLNSSNSSGGAIAMEDGNLSMLRGTLTSNSAGVAGGGVFLFSNGTHNISLSTIENGIAARGGGIDVYGELFVSNSRIQGNFASDIGGGISAFSNSRVNIADSMVASNLTDGDGAGLYVSGSAIVKMENSTISSNEAGGDGGGIWSEGGGETLLANVSVTANTANADATGGGTGGGLDGSTFTLRNTLVAGNASRTDSSGVYGDQDCQAGVVSQGYNLLGVIGSNCFISGNMEGVIIEAAVPYLGGLAANGYETEHHSVGLGSLAINGGNPAGCTNYNGGTLLDDQVGNPRPAVGCDIGAIERQGCVDTTAAVVPTVSGSVLGMSDIIVSWTAESGNDNHIVWMSATEPYLGAGAADALAVGGQAAYSFQVDDAILTADPMAFYTVQGVNGCNERSASSNGYGIFEFSVLRGQ